MGNCATCVDPEVDRKNEAFISPNKIRCEDNKEKFARKYENKENLSPKEDGPLAFDKGYTNANTENNAITAKKYKEMTSIADYEENQENQEFLGENIPKDIEIVKNMPDYSNTSTKATIKSLGEFHYQVPEDYRAEFNNLPFYGPVYIDDRSIYEGQWKNGKRHGKGKQNWTDGSVYDGYWLNDMANVYGRLIHSDGDCYEGEWYNDKAQGKGLYIHKDGAKYEGDWFEDKQHGYGKENWTDGASYEGGLLY